jgi:hypothetical protein
MASPAAHDCPATACTRRIGQRMLMCRPHWFTVPKALRDAVWDAYAGGLGAGSPEHLEAVSAAVRAVNAKLREKAATAAGEGNENGR